MAHIRSILQQPTTKKWAFIEYSDESSTYQVILGNKEFDTQEEAIKHSEGFDPWSYKYQDPSEIKRKRLTDEQSSLEKRLLEIREELTQLATLL